MHLFNSNSHYLPAYYSFILCYTVSENHNTGGMHRYGKIS
nr:MAG TPA: hypothetical protein [Caudoviricetes sp.]